MHQWIDTLLELYICGVLTAEYFYGRSDLDIKREETRRQTKVEKRKKALATPQVPHSGGKKDVAVGSSAQGSSTESSSGKGDLEVRAMPKDGNASSVHDAPRP